MLISSARGAPAPRELLRGSSPVWDASGKRLYYVTPEKLGGTVIQSIEFDEASGRIQGSPLSLGVMTGEETQQPFFSFELSRPLKV